MSETDVLKQDFNWHDVVGSGYYEWGLEGYLKMDGSHGRIKCRRPLKKEIDDGYNAVELSIQFTLGKKYHVLFYDSSQCLVIDCLIDRDGKFYFHNGNGYIESVARLEPNQLWTTESQPHQLRFGLFDFRDGHFQFELNDKVIKQMPLRSKTTHVFYLELQTGIVEPGTVLWLDTYRQLRGDGVIDEERFPHHWKTLPYVPTGYAQEKWDTTTYRPVNNYWLEVCTRYGGMYTDFQPIVHGIVELDMMTQDVQQEAQVSLGEYQRWVTPISPGF